jgi:threonine/homoserine/homoserine lactone efflux protein
MLFWVLAKGILMGLAIAAPVGPIALLCIRRTLAYGRRVGLASGLGAATADGFYGMVAAFGLSAVSTLLSENTDYLQIVGGLFLCYLGLSSFFARPIAAVSVSESVGESRAGSRIEPMARRTILGAYLSTVSLTLTNPATIFSFVAIFAALGITQTRYLLSVTLVFGVFTGSALWWLVLVSGVAYLRNRLTPERLSRLNQVSTKLFGLLILGFGLAALIV